MSSQDKYLKFKKPSFRDGENVTIRRGVEWCGYTGKFVVQNEAGELLGEGQVISASAKRLTDVKKREVELLHDGDLKDFFKLIRFLEGCYPNFDQHEIVTVIRFKITNWFNKGENSAE